jgi:hypothetical protein
MTEEVSTATTEADAGTTAVADGTKALPVTRTADNSVNADLVKAAEQRLAAKGLLDDGSREPGERVEADGTAKAEAETPKLTQRQREMAKQMGLDEADLKSLGNKATKTLDNWATKYDRTFSDLGAKKRELDEAIKAANSGKVDVAAVTAEDEGLDGDEKVEGDEAATVPASHQKAVKAGEFLDGYGYIDPEKVTQWSQAVQERMENLQGILSDLLEERESNQWDQFFTGLDPAAYPDFFDADGNHLDLDDNSSAMLAQKKFKEDVAIHLRGAAFAKKSITLRQAQKRLLPAPNPETIKRAEQDRISTDLQRQSRMGIMRPRGSSGGVPALTEEERLVARAESNLKKKGLMPA